MSLVAPFIEQMRARQAALFDSTVDVTRFAGAGLFDEATAGSAAPSMSSVYSGPGLVRPQRYQVDEVGQTAVVLDTYTVKLPADTAIAVGDVIRVTASAHDERMIGLVLRVTEIPEDEWQIARLCRAVRQTDTPS